MKKKMIKNFLVIVFIILLLTILLKPICLAVDTGAYGGIYDTSTPQKFKNAGNELLGVVQVIGTGVAVIMLVVIGIKYVMASADEKAQLKGQLTVYVIGAILLFAGSNIFTIIAKEAQKL